MDIIVKNALVEAHHFIAIRKRYQESLRQVYSIIIIKIPSIKSNLVFQMSFKAINNCVGPNRLVST